ncbi:MAG: hypothetical protein GY870_11645, partial [archaeon]|nr:hypothetical protein [archaeon]
MSSDGKRVLVVEKDSVVGGRLKVIKKEGFTLDNTSRNLLKYANKSALNKIFQILREKDEEKEQFLCKPIYYYYIFIGADKTKDLIPNQHEKKYMKGFELGWITVPRTMDQMRKSDYFSSWKLMRIFTTGFKCEYDNIKDISLRQFIEEKKLNYHSARYLELASCALMHCPSPDVVSAGEVLRTIKWSSKMPNLFGYPTKGWNAIIEHFVKIIEVKGKILTNCNVESLIIKKNKKDSEIKGVIASLGEFNSNNVILAIPPKNISSLLIDNEGKNYLEPSIAHFIENLVSTAGISFDIALNFIAYKAKGLLYFEKPYGYGIFISNIETSLAPEGKQLMTAFFPIPTNSDDNFIKNKMDQGRKLIETLFPKIKDEIIFERVMVHDMVDSVEVNTNQYKDARPDPQIKGIKGCYITGDYLNAFG